MKMNKKKISILFIVIIMLILFTSLDYLVHWDSKHDPTKRINDIKSNLSNLENKAKDLSEEIFFEDDQFVYYEDRILKHFTYNEENIKKLTLAWENLSKSFPKGTNTLIVPIPNRIIFEDNHNKDVLEYDSFYKKLEKDFLGQATVVDLRDILDEHKEEYIFNRTSMTSNSINSRGGYYASKEVAKALGIDSPIPLNNYHEHVYREHERVIYDSDKMKFSKNSREYSLLENIPNDWTYFYLLPNSKNISEVFLLEEYSKIISIKQPTIVKSGLGSGSIISSEGFEWAIVEGDGKTIDKKDKTLLLISDSSGKYILPYLSNHYKNVYYINLEWNKVLGGEHQRVEEIFENYEITDMVYAQNAYEMGNFSINSAIKRFLDKEVR